MENLLSALRAVGEHTRLRILGLLTHGELTVGEIVSVLDQSQPRVSRHLKLMVEGGLLDRFREGTLVFYRLREDNVGGRVNRAVQDWLTFANGEIEADFEALKIIRQKRFDIAQAYFKENADKWDEIRSLYVPDEEVEAALKALAGPGPHGSVLDVGTGTGRMLELFAAQADQGLGIDVSREMLAVARANLDDKALANCTVRLGDMYALPVEDRSQDLILFHQVLHYADEPQNALRDAARALKPGAMMLIADFAPHDKEFLREEHAHRRLGFGDQEIKNLGQQSGLTCSDIRHLDGGELSVTIWRFIKPATGKE